LHYVYNIICIILLRFINNTSTINFRKDVKITVKYSSTTTAMITPSASTRSAYCAVPRRGPSISDGGGVWRHMRFWRHANCCDGPISEHLWRARKLFNQRPSIPPADDATACARAWACVTRAHEHTRIAFHDTNFSPTARASLWLSRAYP